MTTDVTMALPPLSTYHQHYVSSFGAMEDIKDYVLLSFLQCFQKLIPFLKNGCLCQKQKFYYSYYYR